MYVRSSRSGFHHFPLENKVASCLQDKQVFLSLMEGRFDVADAYLLKRNRRLCVSIGRSIVHGCGRRLNRAGG